MLAAVPRPQIFCFRLARYFELDLTGLRSLVRKYEFEQCPWCSGDYTCPLIHTIRHFLDDPSAQKGRYRRQGFWMPQIPDGFWGGVIKGLPYGR